MNQAIKERTPGSNSPQNWSQINLKYFGDHFQRFAPPFWQDWTADTICLHCRVYIQLATSCLAETDELYFSTVSE